MVDKELSFVSVAVTNKKHLMDDRRDVFEDISMISSPLHRKKKSKQNCIS